MEFQWGHQRRFNAYAPYFKNIFGERVQKISVDAGFTCPNRDGTKSKGGCTYCNNNAFNPSYCHPGKPLSQQISEGIEFHRVRYRRANKYLVFFQPYTNTYAPLEELKKLYAQALQHEQVAGLVISTRPDSIDAGKLDFLKQLSKKYYIAVEYGVESIYDQSLQRINRGDTFSQAKRAIRQTEERELPVGAHFIFGLPGESRQMMLESIDSINRLALTTIKFHQLQIVKGTTMARDFKKHPEDYQLFSFDEYVDFIIRVVEKLNPSFVIERFAGEVPPRFLAGPGWGHIRNDEVNVTIEKEMERRDTWQGKFYN